MQNYFKDCRTAEEGKKLYRDLAKKFHSDNGGNENDMKEINRQFTEWWKNHKDIHSYQSAKENHNSSQFTADDFIEIITNLSTIPDIEIEICGTWLWITGNTYSYKDSLKEFGCRWSKSKKKWYWTKDEYKHSKYTLSESKIRAKYGSEKVSVDRYKRVLIG